MTDATNVLYRELETLFLREKRQQGTPPLSRRGNKYVWGNEPYCCDQTTILQILHS